MSVYIKADSPFWQFDFQIKRRRFYGTLHDERGEPLPKDARRKVAEAREAVLKQRERERIATGPAAGKSKRMTLDVGLGRYWTEHAQHLPSSENLWDYAQNWKRIGAGRRDADGNPDPLLAKHFDQVTNDDIAWYVGHRRGERLKGSADPEAPFVSNRTVNADVEFLRAVFNRARDNWDVSIGERPPKWGAHLLAIAEERIRSATDDEAAAIYNSMMEIRPDFLDVHLFLGLSGRREGEAFSLEKRRVDRRNMRYGVMEKGVRGISGKRLRWYPMEADVLEVIDRNWMNHPTLVFTYICKQSVHNPKRGIRLHKGQRYPFTKDGWRRQWAEILKHAKVTDFRVHDWRHDFATRILANTAGNLKLVQKLLGHSNIATTAKYAHVGDPEQRAALGGISDRIPKKSRVAAD